MKQIAGGSNTQDTFNYNDPKVAPVVHLCSDGWACIFARITNTVERVRAIARMCHTYKWFNTRVTPALLSRHDVQVWQQKAYVELLRYGRCNTESFNPPFTKDSSQLQATLIHWFGNNWQEYRPDARLKVQTDVSSTPHEAAFEGLRFLLWSYNSASLTGQERLITALADLIKQGNQQRHKILRTLKDDWAHLFTTSHIFIERVIEHLTDHPEAHNELHQLLNELVMRTHIPERPRRNALEILIYSKFYLGSAPHPLIKKWINKTPLPVCVRVLQSIQTESPLAHNDQLHIAILNHKHLHKLKRKLKAAIAREILSLAAKASTAVLEHLMDLVYKGLHRGIRERGTSSKAHLQILDELNELTLKPQKHLRLRTKVPLLYLSALHIETTETQEEVLEAIYKYMNDKSIGQKQYFPQLMLHLTLAFQRATGGTRRFLGLLLTQLDCSHDLHKYSTYSKWEHSLNEADAELPHIIKSTFSYNEDDLLSNYLTKLAKTQPKLRPAILNYVQRTFIRHKDANWIVLFDFIEALHEACIPEPERFKQLSTFCEGILNKADIPKDQRKHFIKAIHKFTPLEGYPDTPWLYDYLRRKVAHLYNGFSVETLLPVFRLRWADTHYSAEIANGLEMIVNGNRSEGLEQCLRAGLKAPEDLRDDLFKLLESEATNLASRKQLYAAFFKILEQDPTSESFIQEYIKKELLQDSINTAQTLSKAATKSIESQSTRAILLQSFKEVIRYPHDSFDPITDIIKLLAPYPEGAQTITLIAHRIPKKLDDRKHTFFLTIARKSIDANSPHSLREAFFTELDNALYAQNLPKDYSQKLLQLLTSIVDKKVKLKQATKEHLLRILRHLDHGLKPHFNLQERQTLFHHLPYTPK